MLAPVDCIPTQALAFGTAEAPARFGSDDTPLAVGPSMTANAAAPLAGTATATILIGPCRPDLGRDIRMTLGSGWSGKPQLLRSSDGGSKPLPLTIGGEEWTRFTVNSNETVATDSDAAATYYLLIAQVLRTLDYRVAQ